MSSHSTPSHSTPSQPERSGAYPIEVTRADELERLRLQDEAWRQETAHLLDAIGVAPGWHCLDLGCGPQGLTHQLSQRVGPSGSVTGLDYAQDFCTIARAHAPANVEIVQGDAYATGLPAASFDLVHMRFLASTAGEPERLVAEAKRLLKPGGVLAAQEADGRSLHCSPPLASWDALIAALTQIFPSGMSEDPVSHQLFRLLRQSGFQDVHYRPCIKGASSGEPWADYFPSTSEAVRDVYIAQGIFTADAFDAHLAACRAHVGHPDTVVMGPTMVQTWGRLPS